MDDSENPLSIEIAVEAKLEETGVSARVRSRAASALDRVVGGLRDVAGHPDGRAARIRAEQAVEVQLISEEGKAAVAALYRNPDFGRRVADRIAAEQGRKQVNREAIAVRAIEYLREKDEGDASSGEVDDDWLNVFEAEAEKASSERLRDLWSQVLAGEIRKPGSFSLATLRFISELDTKIAETFQKCAALRISDNQIVKPASEELAGQLLVDLCFLESVGLVYGVHALISQDFPVNASGVISVVLNGLLLVLNPKDGKAEKLRLPMINITRIGVEIISILPPIDEMGALTSIARSLRSHVSDACIYRVVNNKDRSTLVTPVKRIVLTNE